MPSEGESHTVALTGGQITCVITRRRRQKYINLRISLDGKVIVSAPYGISITRIKESLKKKESWITRNLRKSAEHLVDNDPMRRLLLRGDQLTVSAIADPRRKRVVRLDEEARRIEVLTADPSRKLVMPILRSFLVRQARVFFPKRIAELSTLTGIPFQRLFIRNQRTRWGSSSGRGNISVNWRAIMAPPAVQDYLIIHELAHQIQLNHSKAFWKIVEKWCPDYQTASRWLRGHSLLMSLFR